MGPRLASGGAQCEGLLDCRAAVGTPGGSGLELDTRDPTDGASRRGIMDDIT